MSLIQEALKRQMDEQAGQTYVPPPIPKPPRGGKGALKVLPVLPHVLLLPFATERSVPRSAPGAAQA